MYQGAIILMRWCSSVACAVLYLYCGRVPAANAPGCTAAEGLLYKPWSLVVPTCTARFLHQRPSSERRNYLGEKWPVISTESCDFHVTFRDLLHAVNQRHGTDGFTSLPKEGMLKIFSPWKIRRLRPGLNPRTWVPQASTLPLDHPSRLACAVTATLNTLNYP